MTVAIFRLQAVLNERCRERDQRRLELAEAVRAEASLSDRVEALHRQLARPGGTPAWQSPRLDLSHMQSADEYQRALRLDLRRLVAKHAEARTEVARRRQVLVAADQQVRAVEKLRERHKTEFQRQQQARAQRELDESAARVYSDLHAGDSPAVSQ